MFLSYPASSLSCRTCEACCNAQATVKRTYTGSDCLQVEEGAIYGILSSKRRPPDATSRHADFSATLDSELQTAPSLRLIYLYLLWLAQDKPKLDPSQRPTTAAELKWTDVNSKRKRSASLSDDDIADDGDSDEDAEDDDGDAASGKGDDKSDNADSNDSEGTTGADGPSAHTRSKEVKSSAHNTSVKARHVSRKHGLYTLQAGCEQFLTQLPLFTRPSLGSNAIRIGKDCVVRLSPPSLYWAIVWCLSCIGCTLMAAHIACALYVFLLLLLTPLTSKPRTALPTPTWFLVHTCVVSHMHTTMEDSHLTKSI